MKNFGLLLLAACFTTACDPGDESLGDSGGSESSAVGETSGGVGSTGGTGGTQGTEETGSSSETTAAPQGDPCDGIDGWCLDTVEFELGGVSTEPGVYTFELRRGSDDELLDSCELTLPGGEGNCAYASSSDSSVVTLSLAEPSPDLQSATRLVITHSGVVIHDETQELDYEISEDACYSCTLASGEVDLTGAQCTGLEGVYEAAFQEVRSCKEASECGTVIPGFSCGCTRDWVGRVDADPAQLTEAADAGLDAKCDWAGWGGSCDCPETDGFDCIDNICTWNYVSQ